MRLRVLAPLLALAASLGGCGYYPADPIRYVTSPAEVGSCHRLGVVGLARTDGMTTTFGDVTALFPELSSEPPGYVGGPQGEIAGPNFRVRLDIMRDTALGLGATDLLLSRRIYRDWSYVQGTAYRCRR